MALGIKKVEAERRAQNLATGRGTTVTGAIIGAVDYARRRTRDRRVAASIREAIFEISDRCAALPDFTMRSADKILGYEEQGAFRCWSPICQCRACRPQYHRKEQRAPEAENRY